MLVLPDQQGYKLTACPVCLDTFRPPEDFTVQTHVLPELPGKIDHE